MSAKMLEQGITSGDRFRSRRLIFRAATLTAFPLLLLVDPGPVSAKYGKPWYVNPGLIIGGDFSLPKDGKSDNGVVLGAEMSFLLVGEHMVFWGPFTESVYDWQRRGSRVSCGLVVGLRLPWPRLVIPPAAASLSTVGLDASYLYDFAGRGHHGVGLRAFYFLGPLGVYLRYAIMIGTEDFLEFGMMLKIPICVAGC